MVCPNCRKENNENNKFCTECGYLLKKTNENNSIGLNILSVVMGLPSILYLFYYVLNLFNFSKQGDNSVNMVYFIAINIAILIFLAINYHNLFAKIFLILDIISIVLVIFAGLFLIGLPIDCLGVACTSCCSIDGGGPEYNGFLINDDGSCTKMFDGPFRIYF